MITTIEYYYAQLVTPYGSIMHYKQFSDKIPLLNRRAAYRYLNDLKEDFSKYGNEEQQYLSQCSRQIGFRTFDEDMILEATGKDRPDNLIQVKAIEYKVYLMNGYNIGGEEIQLINAGKLLYILRDNATYQINNLVLK